MYLATIFFLYPLLLVSSVYGFCIYNNHADETFYWIRQTAGHGITWRIKGNRFMAEHLGQGENKCCHFSNYDCNMNMDQDSLLNFAVQRTSGDKKQDMFDIDCPAGGYIVFNGTWESPAIQVFYPDHSVFHHSFQWNPTNSRYYSKYENNAHAMVSSGKANSSNSSRRTEQ